MALLMRLQKQLKPPTYLQTSVRAFALPERAPVEDENDPKFTVTVNPYKLHNLEDGPSREARKLLPSFCWNTGFGLKHFVCCPEPHARISIPQSSNVACSRYPQRPLRVSDIRQ